MIRVKLQERSASNEPVNNLQARVRKFYGRGLFISVNGFSTEELGSLVVGKEVQTLPIDEKDSIVVLEGLLTFWDMIDRKVKAVRTKGLIYIHPISGAEQ